MAVRIWLNINMTLDQKKNHLSENNSAMVPCAEPRQLWSTRACPYGVRKYEGFASSRDPTAQLVGPMVSHGSTG